MPFDRSQYRQALEAQQRAAQDTSKQVRLVAGPGTGKSNTIECRVAFLIDNGRPLNRIVIVSFTNASVRDLEERLKQSLGNRDGLDYSELRISTLHSLAMRMLKSAGRLEQYPFPPMVLSKWELESMYDPEFGEDKGVTSKIRRRDIRAFFEAFWNTGEPDSATYVPADPPITDQERDSFESFHVPTSQVYSCVLPGEIVKKCVDLHEDGLISIPELAKCDSVIVDEYQDLNPVDIRFLDILANSGISMFVAGDDDQSIYSFRHASPIGIQGFHKRFPDSTHHSLEACFRCCPKVLTAAHALLNTWSSPERLPKDVFSLFSSSTPQVAGTVYRWKFPSGDLEAQAIARSCGQLLDKRVPAHRIFILLPTVSRRSGLWATIEGKLQEEQIPYSPPRELGFVDSDAGHLVSSLCRIIGARETMNAPADPTAHRIILGLRKGVGIGTCNGIRRSILQSGNLTYLDLFYADVPAGLLNKRESKAVECARDVIQRTGCWKRSDTIDSRRDAIGDIIEFVIGTEESQKEEWMEFSGELPDDFNLAELQGYLQCENDADRQKVLANYSARVDYSIDDKSLLPSRVRVMSMHNAKGLTADVVFVPGLEEGFLPNDFISKQPALILEAARLLYVSMSRARAGLILSYSSNRLLYGNRNSRRPSRFLEHTSGPFSDGRSGLSATQADQTAAMISDMHRVGKETIGLDK